MHVVAEKSGIYFEIPSVTLLVDPLVSRCEKVFREKKLSDSVARMVCLVLRELLNNAIKHGNNNEPQLSVRGCLQYVGEQELHITVEDEGPGFDYTSIDTQLPENPSYLQKRGYILISSLAERVRFNERGNCVTAELALKRNSCLC